MSQPATGLHLVARLNALPLASGERPPLVGQIRQLISQTDNQGIISFLHDHLANASLQASLQALLHCSRPTDTADTTEAAAGVRLRSTAADWLLQLLMQPSSPLEQQLDEAQGMRDVEKALHALSTELNGLPSDGVIKILDSCVNVFQSGGCHRHLALILVPKALQLLMTAATSSGGCGGEDVKRVVQAICSADWPKANVASIIVALQDLPPMSPELLDSVISKSIATAKSLDITDIPAFVNQLLKLRTSGAPLEKLLLGLTELLKTLEEQVQRKGPEQQLLLHDIQGTVLLSVDMVAKHNANLASAWVKVFSKAPLSPFLLAVVLAVSSGGAAEKQAHDAVHALIVRTFRHESSMVAASRRVGWTVPTCARLRAITAEELQSIFLQLSQRCGCGWENAVQPAVSVCLSVLEQPDVNVQQLHTAAFLGSDVEASSASARAMVMAVRVLQEVFVKQEAAQAAIIDIIQDRTIGVPDSQALPFIYLLATIVRNAPAHVLDRHVQRIKTCLESILQLPLPSSMALLLAVWPLCRARKDVLDDVMMKLKKLQFLHDLRSRMMAVHSFMFVVLQELRHSMIEDAQDSGSASCSQLSLSQHASLSGGGGLTLLHEFLNFLRRSLNQQAPVKAALYRGLEVMACEDPGALDALLTVLLPHCSKYCNQEHVPPLKLDNTVAMQSNAVRLYEPLHALLSCCHQLHKRSGVQLSGTSDSLALLPDSSMDAASGSVDAAQLLAQLLTTIRDRTVQSELEEWEFDSARDYSTASVEGAANLCFASVLLGCLEVLMEHSAREAVDNCSDPAIAERTGNDLRKLFALHQRLATMAAEGQKAANRALKRAAEEDTVAAAGPKKRKGANGAPMVPVQGTLSNGPCAVTDLEGRASLLTCDALCMFLTAIQKDGLVPQTGGSGAPGPHAKLARDPNFIAYVLHAAQRQLQQLNSDTMRMAVELGCQGHDSAEQALALLCTPLQAAPLSAPLYTACKLTIKACAQTLPKGKTRREGAEAVVLNAAKCLRAVVSTAGCLQALHDLVVLWGLDGLTDGYKEQLAPLQSQNAELYAAAMRLPALLDLLGHCLRHGALPEAEVLLAAIRHCYQLLRCKEVSDLLSSMVIGQLMEPPEDGITHPGCLKALLALGLDLEDHDNVLATALAADILLVLGHYNDAVAPAPAHSVKVITPATVQIVLGVFLDHLTARLVSLDWCLQQWKSAKDIVSPSLAVQQAVRDMEEQVVKALAPVVTMCQPLCQGVHTLRGYELLAPMLTRLYKSMTAVAKGMLPPKGVKTGGIPGRYRMLVEQVLQLNNCIDDMVQGWNDCTNEEAHKENAKKTEVKGKLKREGLLIPRLVKEMESHTKQLVQLGNAVKQNLLATAKRANNRSFRLQFMTAAQQ